MYYTFSVFSAERQVKPDFKIGYAPAGAGFSMPVSEGTERRQDLEDACRWLMGDGIDAGSVQTAGVVIRFDDARKCRIEQAKMAEVLRSAAIATPHTCPACSEPSLPEHRDAHGVSTCPACGGISTTRPVPSAVARLYVLNEWTDGPNPPADQLRYFDLTTRDGAGKLSREHGWYDTKTRKIVQAG